MISRTNQREVGSHVAAVYDAMQAEYDQLEEQFYFASCYQVYRECVRRIASARPSAGPADRPDHRDRHL
jgi:hypothetical protein